MSDHSHDNQEEQTVGHVVSPKILIGTGILLMVLTVITVVAAKFDFAQYDLPEVNVWVAMSIAVVKATLVCLFFMHLRWDPPFNAFVFVGGIVFVLLFITFALSDRREYQDRLDPGDGAAVQQKLDQLEQG